MDEENIFSRMNALVEKVGHDPDAVARSFGAIIGPAYLGINGMVTKLLKRYRIALNRDQEPYQYTFAFWHEDFHILDHHLELAGFLNEDGLHCDTDSFSKDFAKRMTVYTERIANLGAADQMLDTGKVLERIGYYTLVEYRNARRDHWNMLLRYQRIRDSLQYTSSAYLKTQFAEAHKDLKRSYEKIMDMEREFSYGDFMTISQIASEFGVPDHYVEYKLEALRLQDFDIDVQELKSYEKVFNKRRAVNEIWD